MLAHVCMRVCACAFMHAGKTQDQPVIHYFARLTSFPFLALQLLEASKTIVNKIVIIL